jgi:hypothetical protein
MRMNTIYHNLARNQPIIGIACCCALAASGQAAAEVPRRVRKERRFMALGVIQ